MDQLRADLAKSDNQIDSLKGAKLETKEAEHSFKKVGTHLHQINDRLVEISNQ
jgi:uncharacterized protein YpuA (DUF1002 family)